jgi:flagellar basal-body rod protein FlgB
MLNGIANRLEHYLDLVSARQKLVASNIANANTPGYHTKDIDFHFEFMSQVEKAASTVENQPAVPLNVLEVDGLGVRNDGNNVSLEREMRLLSENASRFNVAVNLWKSQMRAVRMAIQETKNA